LKHQNRLQAGDHSAGSFDAAKETERDHITTGADGIATTKDLPYGTYVVHQSKGGNGRQLVADFDVSISVFVRVNRECFRKDFACGIGRILGAVTILETCYAELDVLRRASIMCRLKWARRPPLREKKKSIRSIKLR